MKADLYINGYIGEMFDLFGESNNFSLNKLNDFLSNLSSDVTELDVHINSGGGLVTEGFAIHDKLVNTGLTINTIVEGMCGSIATVIAQAGKSGSRKMFQNSEYFIHNPLWIPSAPDAHTADDLEKLTAELKRNEVKLVDFYAKVTGSDKLVLSEKMKVETTLTSKEAKELGFIDEIISTDIQAFVRYRIAAAVQPITKQKTDNTMATLKAEFAELAANLTNEFKNLLKGKIVNETTKTSEGVDIYFEGELMVGSKVFLDESMTTPAPDGVHTVGTKVFTVADGVVTEETEVGEAVNEAEVAAAKIAELEANNAAKDAELQAVKAEKETLIANVAKLQTEFVNFQNKIVTGGENIFNVAPQDKQSTPAKTDVMSQVLELRKSKSK